MSWFTWSAPPTIEEKQQQQQPKKDETQENNKDENKEKNEKKEDNKDKKNEKKDQDEQVFTDFLKIKLPVIEEARRPVIDRLQIMSDAWKSGDVVWYINKVKYNTEGSCLFVARQHKIQDVHRYEKNDIKQMAMLLDHELHVFFDLKNAWNEHGAYKGSGGLFPVMLNDRDIIRALIAPYIVLFDQ